MKTTKQMERHLRGAGNHYRIQILLLLSARKTMTLENIVTATQGSEKTIGEHTRRLLNAGLINKHYRGRYVEHALSPHGKLFARFLKELRMK